jgi:hypothetical protein
MKKMRLPRMIRIGREKVTCNRGLKREETTEKLGLALAFL